MYNGKFFQILYNKKRRYCACENNFKLSNKKLRLVLAKKSDNSCQQTIRLKHTNLYFIIQIIVGIIICDSLLQRESPILQKTLIVEFYQNHQKYKQATKIFHKLALYIFVSVQVIWFILSFNITTFNKYDNFISQFEENFNRSYNDVNSKAHPKFNDISEHVNSFASDYTIICWLIWLSHFGFEVVFAYIVYVNRMFFKEYTSGVKQMLPIFFTLLTTFVIRDCLMMSVSQVVRYDLGQIKLLIETQSKQFSTYGPSFLSFISTSLVSIDQFSQKFQYLEILTYVQQLCDSVIICVLTVQIFRIYSIAVKCSKYVEEIKEKKQFAIDEIKTPPSQPSHTKFSQLGSKASEERQYSTVHHHDPIFASQRYIYHPHKQIIDEYSHLGPIGYSSKNFYRSSNKVPNFHKKEAQIHDNPHKAQGFSNIKKLKKSGSCNYLKGSQYISQENVIHQKKRALANQLNEQKCKLKKHLSFDYKLQNKEFNQKNNNQKSQDNLPTDQKHVFYKF